jgi:DNA-binding MarR family transcriptional regulator
VDALTASWAERRPDLDFTPVSVIARLRRVRAHLDRALDEVFASYGLGAATFGVLVTLARIGDGAGVSQRRLMDELGLTSGTVSVRMDRLVEEGLVERRVDPESRRTTLITLTPEGRALFERVVPAHLANERRLLAALTTDEQDLLASLLRKLLVEFEGSAPPAGAPPALGLTVAPAAETIARRAAVGLTPAAGLLVRSLDAHGPAAGAGVRVGDVLVAAAGRELRSVAALYAAIADAGQGALRLQVLRGSDQLHLTVALAAPHAIDGALAGTAGRGTAGEHRL